MAMPVVAVALIGGVAGAGAFALSSVALLVGALVVVWAPASTAAG
jgi:hypothetical protein